MSSLKQHVDAVLKRNFDRQVEGAKVYASFDKSDPFTFARCMTHIKQGICGAVVIGPEKGGNGHYEATVLSTEDGRAQFHNVRRP